MNVFPDKELAAVTDTSPEINSPMEPVLDIPKEQKSKIERLDLLLSLFNR